MGSVIKRFRELFIIVTLRVSTFVGADINLPTVATSISGAGVIPVGIGDYRYVIRMPPPPTAIIPVNPHVGVACGRNLDNAWFSFLGRSNVIVKFTLEHDGSTMQVIRNATNRLPAIPGINVYICRLSVTSGTNGLVTETSARLEVIAPLVTSDNKCTSSLGFHGFNNEITVVSSITPEMQIPPGLICTPKLGPIPPSSVTSFPLQSCRNPFSTCLHFVNETFSCHYMNESTPSCTIQLHQAETLQVDIELTIFAQESERARDVIVFNCSTLPLSSQIRWRINSTGRADSIHITVNQSSGASLLVINADSIRMLNIITFVECMAERSGFSNSSRLEMSAIKFGSQGPALTRQPPIPMGTYTQRTATIPSTSHSVRATLDNPVSPDGSSMERKAPLQGSVIGAVAAVITLLVIFVVFLIVARFAYRKVSKTYASENTVISDVFPSGTESTANPAYQSYDDEHEQDPAHPHPGGPVTTLNQAFHSENNHYHGSYSLPIGTESTLNPAYQSYDDYNQYQSLSGPQPAPVYSSLHSTDQSPS